ncbi:T-box-containing protein TBX6L [Austrofundulus limnaeus]|uniref:T-box-containing protein TBX6L n=1 Tax=Austrofundulus limnaeus TaxID=52670 RepID=A0A2I4AQU3_AUSLI|nr:PREDICTED: T-box-containing protein TBX6L-like [Austrofundulus limnaeus]
MNPSRPRSPSAPHCYQQGLIRMTLENAELWKAFHRTGTEMIITKHGRRMFPHCCVSLSGLQPSANYVVMVDIVPADTFKYKWKKKQWEVTGKAEPQPPCRTYIHPSSPAAGSHWMKQSLSFLKMKLTNNMLDQHGHIILHSMHRYYPRFHVVQADNPYSLCRGNFQTFSFPETVFTAVTAYQNPKITKLKIDNNSFAKRFRKGDASSQSQICHSKKIPPTKQPPKEKDSRSRSPGLQRMPSTSQSSSTPQPLKGGHLSTAWCPKQDSSGTPHPEPPELHEYDYSCEEQMVPTTTAYRPYRHVQYTRIPSGDKTPAQTTIQPPPPSLPTPERDTQQRAYHYNQQGHGRTADWSQYPLFSYSCW